jgi:hypothetical protein
MRRTITTLSLVSTLAISQAVIVNFDLSPPGTDRAVGLSPLNEVPAVTNSAGSGNEIGTGISFDTDTLTLTLSLGYGSAFGFTDLTGPASSMHIHAPAPTNLTANVLISLAPIHTPATNPALGGSIIGSIVYTPEQVPFLLAGSNYINVHTGTNPGGEIRGQLIALNTAPTVFCPQPATLECDGSGGRMVALTAQTADVDGNALTAVWTVDGAPVLTNSVAAGGPPTAGDVMLVAFLTLGTHQVVLSVSDAITTVSCTTTVTIVDTQPPVITSAGATPNSLWPPNHKMVPVAVSVVATDICSSVTCRIKNITSNEPGGKGKKALDWSTNGPLSAKLRAARLGKGNGRTYTLTIECTDTAGNTATRDVTVSVPHDQGKKSGNGNNNGNGNANGNNGNGSGNGNNNGNGNGNSGSKGGKDKKN